MKLHIRGNEVELVLSRRNLVTLLTKLDRDDSAHTIVNNDAFEDGKPVDGRVFVLRAENDQDHYADRPAGAVLEELEAAYKALEAGYKAFYDMDPDDELPPRLT